MARPLSNLARPVLNGVPVCNFHAGQWPGQCRPPSEARFPLTTALAAHGIYTRGRRRRPVPGRYAELTFSHREGGRITCIDVDAQGNGTARQQRLYQLIRQHGPITDRTFEIIFPGPGVQAYVFTFG